VRSPFLRLLLVGGGAIILATAGFAYMASNSVAATSAGEGSGLISGYTVSNVSFTPEVIAEYGPTYTSDVQDVSFTLTANDTKNPSAETAPTFILVYFTNDGQPANGLAEYYGPRPTNSELPSPGLDNGSYCTFGVPTPSTGPGPWDITCAFNEGAGLGPAISSITGIDVEANQ
jgi:hypothetical protein